MRARHPSSLARPAHSAAHLGCACALPLSWPLHRCQQSPWRPPPPRQHSKAQQATGSRLACLPPHSQPHPRCSMSRCTGCCHKCRQAGRQAGSGCRRKKAGTPTSIPVPSAPDSSPEPEPSPPEEHSSPSSSSSSSSPCPLLPSPPSLRLPLSSVMQQGCAAAAALLPPPPLPPSRACAARSPPGGGGGAQKLRAGRRAAAGPAKLGGLGTASAPTQSRPAAGPCPSTAEGSRQRQARGSRGQAGAWQGREQLCAAPALFWVVPHHLIRPPALQGLLHRTAQRVMAQRVMAQRNKPKEQDRGAAGRHGAPRSCPTARQPSGAAPPSCFLSHLN